MDQHLEWYDEITSTYDIKSSIPDVLPDIGILEFLHDRQNPDALESVSLTFVIPNSGRLALPYTYTDPLRTGYLTVTRSSDDNEYEKISGTGSISSDQVWVKPGSNRLEFNPDQSGSLITIDMRAGFTAITPSLFGVLWASLQRTQEVVMTDTLNAVWVPAGEDLDRKFCYIAPDGKAYISDPSDINKPVHGYCNEEVSIDGWFWLQRTGAVETEVDLPHLYDLFLGRDGNPTWIGDTVIGRKLENNDWRRPVGYRNPRDGKMYLNGSFTVIGREISV